MRISACFVAHCAVTGPACHAFVADLEWAWGEFTKETGVATPDDWLRQLYLEHGVIVEEPDPGRYWRGWRVRGIALNREYADRFASYRVARLGFGLLPAR